MEKPGIEPATPGLQGIALIHYTTGASQTKKAQQIKCCNLLKFLLKIKDQDFLLMVLRYRLLNVISSRYFLKHVNKYTCLSYLPTKCDN